MFYSFQGDQEVKVTLRSRSGFDTNHPRRRPRFVQSYIGQDEYVSVSSSDPGEWHSRGRHDCVGGELSEFDRGVITPQTLVLGRELGVIKQSQSVPVDSTPHFGSGNGRPVDPRIGCPGP